MLELVGFCSESAQPYDVGDDVGGDNVGDDVGDDVGGDDVGDNVGGDDVGGDDVGDDVGNDVSGDDVGDDVGGDDGGHGNVTVGERFIDCPYRPRRPKYNPWINNYGADKFFPSILRITLLRE